ncbi:MAG: hypothetical protein IPN53_05115 [Comamonadaceae bacterium]|nr:hypothetical protein [Comamonadaceae bacterium]
MASRKPKLSQVLPIWTSDNATAANLFFQMLLDLIGITDIHSYIQKWRIPIVISVIVCAFIGAANGGLRGFVIGGLLGIVAPVALLWLGVMLTLIAMYLAIYFAAWAVIVWILWALFFR